MEQPITGFEMQEKLGEGGMASVWKARQVSLDRTVAIKILSSGLASEPSDIEMFQKEAQQAAKLKHPGIVQVYDANAESGLYFFVMEYVGGYTVGDWARRKGCLGEKDALLVAECVADALEYAWNSSRIIHCDIKPDNVMIDADGSVKVTDLGLARTISAMTDEDGDEEVMGTPAYISPEQAMGRSGMDFRTDMYSLGAMLYHLATGRLMFDEYEDEEVMELQVNGRVEDALDLNPTLSKPFCWLIEKMLAKDPDNRPASWEEVRKDIEKVKKHYMPIGCLDNVDLSTMKRSASRTKSDHNDIPLDEAPAKSKRGMVIAAIAVLAVSFLAGFGIIKKSSQSEANQAANQQNTKVSQANPIRREAKSQRKEQASKEMYEFAEQWAKSNPNSHAAAIDRFSAVSDQTKGSKYSLMAQDEIKRIKLSWAKEKSKVMRTLADETKYFIDNDELAHAANLYTEYKGPFSKDTHSMREKKASEIRALEKSRKEAVAKEARRVVRKYEDTLNGIAQAILDGGVAAGVPLVKAATFDVDLAEHREKFTSLSECLGKADKVDERILATFNDQRGERRVLDIDGVRKNVVIDGVKDGKIQVRLQIGTSKAVIIIDVDVSQLSVKEKLGRMGDDSLPDVALVKGLIAVKSGSKTYAKAFFERTHPLISTRLTELMEGVTTSQLEKDAKESLQVGLASMGIKVQPEFDVFAWGSAIGDAKLSSTAVRRAHSFAAAYKSKYGATKFGKEADPVIEYLLSVKAMPAGAKAAPLAASAPHPTVKVDLSNHEALNPDNLVAAFLDNNPRVDRNDVSVMTDSSGHIYKFTVSSPYLEDISCLAGCKALREVYCGAVKPGEWFDPERRSPLRYISALKGKALEKLYLAGTSVKNIEVVKGMPLTSIDLQYTPVSDIGPLRSMNLVYLNLGDSMVKDISSISRMSLENLNLSGTKIHNFSALLRKPIKRLGLGGTQFKDITILKGMPLVSLDISNTNVSRLDTIASMDLDELRLAGTKIKDFSPLSGMELKSLDVSQSSFSDLSVLNASALKSLDISESRVTSLLKIRDMPNLQKLAISGCKIDDLGDLSGVRIKHLDCKGFAPRDLVSLQRMDGLLSLVVDDAENWEYRKAVKGIRGLRQLNWNDLHAF